MNRHQAHWASQHDWYLGTMKDNGVFLVMVRDFETGLRLTFDNYKELREWAGY